MELQYRAETRIQFYSHLKKYLCKRECPFCHVIEDFWDNVKPKEGEKPRKVFCKKHEFLRYGDNDGGGYMKRDKTGAKRGSA